MSVEKDLQQSKPFTTNRERAVVNVLFTSRYIETKLTKEYKRYGITLKQYNILRILRGAGKPISTQVIRERMIDRMSDISRIVDRMVDKGIATKRVNKQDKRLVDIEISEKGLNIVSEMNHLSAKLEEFIGSLTEEDAIQLNILLDKLRDFDK